jgi:DNA adenine methylase
MKPLYMWAGGKNKMIKQYLEQPGIPTDGFDTFVEPFFGGGAMTIWVYENCPNVKRFVINDIKEELVGIYTAIKTDVDNFIKRMDDLQSQYIPLEKDERKEWFYDLRTPYATNQHNWSSTEESATLYFLMKTAFNGIWQTTKRANGRFDTPFGLGNQKDSVYDKDNVLEWHKFLQIVDIHCGDWHDACDTVDERAFYFFDPPYRDSFTSYGEGFTDEDHVALIDYSKQMDNNGDIVFYCNRADSDDGFFDKNKGQLIDTYYDINYTAGRRATEEDGSRTSKAATEILLHSVIKKTFGNNLFEEIG